MSSQTLLTQTAQTGEAVNPEPSLSSPLWLQGSVQEFFSGFNWEDNPPEMQQVKLTSLEASTAPLNLTLTVDQFFAAFNWDGATIAAALSTAPPVSKAAIEVTVDDFFSQF
jgi:hypothetical protein